MIAFNNYSKMINFNYITYIRYMHCNYVIINGNIIQLAKKNW